MCGRFRLSRREQFLRDHYGIEDDAEWAPRYNIAPTQQVAVIRQHPNEPKRTFATMRWGLIPHWATNPNGGASMINARAETAAEKPAFSEPLKKRRCLIAADGFYEWQRRNGSKQPYCFTMIDDAPFSFAGLWDGWRAPDGQWIRTCSILTTTPNALLADVHDRMPVILSPDVYDLWLDPEFSHAPTLIDLMKPFDAKAMRRFAVSSKVNAVANDDESVCCPMSEAAPEAQIGLGFESAS
jgi:putative SOS response-associated peptidase YedK